MFDEEMFVGSRTMWKKQNDTNLWWKCLTVQMAQFCRDYPKYVLFGEVFGSVQDMKYDRKGVEFIAFDIMKPDLTYMEYDEFTGLCDQYEIQRVPELYRGEFNLEKLKELAEHPSKLYEGGKEGLVVRTVPEQTHIRAGRLCFKIVSNWYYER
jgi:ATP-dependent RNA circularization protein (DNA/RNA ligase family)